MISHYGHVLILGALKTQHLNITAVFVARRSHT